MVQGSDDTQVCCRGWSRYSSVMVGCLHYTSISLSVSCSVPGGHTEVLDGLVHSADPGPMGGWPLLGAPVNPWHSRVSLVT